MINLATRRVEIAGVHVDACETEMLQWVRDLTDGEDGFLKDKRILIHDRDSLFTKKFRETLKAAGVRALKRPGESPNLNPVAESFVRNIKGECVDRMLLFGERHVR